MRNKLILFGTLFCLLLPLSSCNYFRNVQALSRGKIERENYVSTVPFELRKDLIVVEATINNDSIPHSFIFDTGAFNSKVAFELADQHNLKVVAQKNNSTAQGISQPIKVIQIDSLHFGSTTIYNASAGKLKYGANSASPCIAESGIIGANIMKLAHWKIDYQKMQLHYSDEPFEPAEGAQTLPFERPALSGTPKVDVLINDKAVKNILFDVGYNGGLVLPMSIAGAFPTNHTDTILDLSTSGIYGSNLDTVLVKHLKVSVAGFSTEMPVQFSSLNKALLGNAFLKHFDITIDYDQNEISLTPVAAVNIVSGSSFLVAPQGSMWKVVRTRTDMPFALGDLFVKLNGKRPDEVFEDYCDFVLHQRRMVENGKIILEDESGEIHSVIIE